MTVEEGLAGTATTGRAIPASVLKSVIEGIITTNAVTSITAGEGLSGGTISTTGTISHAIPTGATATTYGSTATNNYIKQVTTDKYGHVTGVVSSEELPTLKTLTFGNGGVYSYNGTADVTVPVYTGEVIEPDV